jgi:hypothetical protein
MSRRILLSLLSLSLVTAAALFGVLGPAGAASTVRYDRTWSPPLNLPSNYRPCCPSKATFKVLPFSMNVKGSQQAQLTVRVKTNWVDSKAISHTPNIIQQGRYVMPIEFKIQIGKGHHAADHRAQCRVAGSTGVVIALGPKIDVANGQWHTIECVKYTDGASSTAVLVIVDGVSGATAHSPTRIGDVISSQPVDLGGQGSTANGDSLDGRVSLVKYVVS